MRRVRNCTLALAASVVSLFAAAGAAQAMVVDMGAAAALTGNASYGLAFALAPPLFTGRADAGVTPATAAAPCTDPALTSDLLLPNTGLCYQGGPVMHSNETFALTWDPIRSYWQTTRDYVEQYLSDVATASGNLSSPYAVATQYSDAGGRVQNESAYGGGCIDYGSPGGFTCQFGDASGSGTGNNYPANGCTPSGANQFYELPDGAWSTAANSVCLTDDQVRSDLTSVIGQSGLLSHARSGYTPLVVLLTPPGVEVCLDGSGSVCSANGAATASFCSYHSQVNVGGTEVAYLVQPWVAQWGTLTGCVDPGAPTLPTSGNVDAQTAATDVGAQLVSPLSQSQIAAMTDPAMNGWTALDGTEIDDHGCIPLGNGLDSTTVGSGTYFLQWEFNNAGVMQSDPNSPVCANLVNLAPAFVVPTSVEQGDVVELDGSTTVSSLIVPKANYAWSFGDGSTAVGPSVVHTYGTAGNYTIKLTVTDRGGNVASLSQTISVLGPKGQTPPKPTPNAGGNGLQARIQLMPQGLKALLRRGILLRVTANQAADGFVSLSIPRRTARRAHLHGAGGAWVTIGRGTVSSVTTGTVNLRVHLSRRVASKLSHLRHVSVSVRMTLTAVGGAHVTVDAAGRY